MIGKIAEYSGKYVVKCPQCGVEWPSQKQLEEEGYDRNTFYETEDQPVCRHCVEGRDCEGNKASEASNAERCRRYRMRQKAVKTASKIVAPTLQPAPYMGYQLPEKLQALVDALPADYATSRPYIDWDSLHRQ